MLFILIYVTCNVVFLLKWGKVLTLFPCSSFLKWVTVNMKEMLCFVSFHFNVHFSGNRKKLKYGGDNWDTTDINCSIFDLRIELKCTWLTSVWLTSIHCIDSRWVTPYLHGFFGLDFFSMWLLIKCENCLQNLVQSWSTVLCGSSVKNICHVSCWEACVMRKYCHVSASFTEKYTMTFELSRHYVKLANSKRG